jgi:hypothetical protein
MIWQKIMKYPILMVGILMFTIFITNTETQKWLGKHFDRFKPSNCRVQLERVEDNMKYDWDVECHNEALKITQDYTLKDSKFTLKQQMYRQIANNYAHLAQLSNPETLELIQQVYIILKHPDLNISSESKGSEIIKFNDLKTQEDMMRHLKFTVKVKEF